MRTRRVSAAQMRAYVNKAQEYSDAAVSELEADRFIAASSLAVHAEINAADAVCGARIGRDGAAIERELRQLLPLKTMAEYEPDDIARSTATKAVERATRCVQIAQRVADAHL